MWDVVLIAEQQLQCVRPRRQRQFNLGLPAAKVEMVFVVRDRLIEGRQIRIDQQVMMAGIGLLRSRGRNAHSMQPEVNVVLGPMTAPSLRSTNSTFAPGGDGVGPPVAADWEKALEP